MVSSCDLTSVLCARPGDSNTDLRMREATLHMAVSGSFKLCLHAQVTESPWNISVGPPDEPTATRGQERRNRRLAGKGR